ncbi:hypothetical protein G7075_04455 [Phycicoccus sp. HDW14]|uniref:hypothetical protein n=1 Tax=Phycicoccus sp. HDW14 TaxID=2714941 RepID=UPI00140A771D|nr:hypothetical protein [Phycicoccus sp. HDW14]QIM19906.1 hypothetical protein G7075_00145 [Phycicoccus sp. HDW14]QIM20569.1 hypothetical protein G7075_04455 [Phycicoccus sp. HDW14]
MTTATVSAGPSVEQAVQAEERAWSRSGALGRQCAAALRRGDADTATELAHQTFAAEEWWAETFQQLKDLRRLNKALSGGASWS